MKAKILLVLIFNFILSKELKSQGLNHNYLLGYLDSAWLPNSPSPDAYISYTSTSASILAQVRVMKFRTSQANISDTLGNILFYTNGGWIANAKGDTLMNGDDINPSTYTTINADLGFNFASMQLIIPYPDSIKKYVLFHQTFSNSVYSSELYYSIVDMTLDSNNGGVVQNQKNLIAFSDSLVLGISACKHANGRDWWITILKDSSDIVYTLLLTPNGVTNVSWQHLNVPDHDYFITPPLFSPDGHKYSYIHSVSTGNMSNPYLNDLRIFDFDRCTGLFSNPIFFNLTDSGFAGTTAFSSDSKFLFSNTTIKISQFDLQASNIEASKQIVAMYDTFSTGGFTDFCRMYLAADGKIYISPCYSAIYFSVINRPDSLGLACDVQQHSLQSPCYLFDNHVNHPNYYLGRLQGSPCDTLQWTGIKEPENDFRFRVYPNPVTSNSLSIGYLLPQNKSGLFQLIDVNGKIVFSYALPQWSNEQSFQLPELANGIYNAIIISNNQRVSKTIAIIKE